MQARKSILVIVSLLIVSGSIAEAADIRVSGGEDHTLVLSENKFTWGCAGCRSV